LHGFLVGRSRGLLVVFLLEGIIGGYFGAERGLAFRDFDEEVAFSSEGMSAFGEVLLWVLFYCVGLGLVLFSIVFHEKLFKLYDLGWMLWLLIILGRGAFLFFVG
jgi:hypothetical protein